MVLFHWQCTLSALRISKLPDCAKDRAKVSGNDKIPYNVYSLCGCCYRYGSCFQRTATLLPTYGLHMHGKAS